MTSYPIDFTAWRVHGDEKHLSKRTCFAEIAAFFAAFTFNVIIYRFIYNTFRLTNSSTKLIAINLSQIILVTLGIGLIVIGNIISKTKNNKLTGIRHYEENKDEKNGICGNE